MLQAILTIFSSTVGKSAMEGIFKWLAFRSFQRALRDTMVDWHLDCVENYMEEELNLSQKEVKKMRRKLKRPAEKEFKIRISALIMAFAKQ